MPEEAASSRFDELLASGFASQLLAAESEELERLLPSERSKVDSELERQKRHDDLLTVAASAFAPGGRLRRATGYEFITCEPLVELKEQGCKSFDVLVANREQGVGIFPECKSSIANPGPEIGDLYATISDLESRVEYLEKRTGVPLKRREY